MSLTLPTRRKEQTLSAKWSTQQHLAQHLNTDVIATSTNLFRRHNHQSYCYNQPLLKQKSLLENLQLNRNILTNHTGRSYLSRGLSVGRSHDIQRSTFSHQASKKHSFITAKSFKGKNEQENLKTADLITKNEKARDQSEILRNSRRVQTSSSTVSILKTLDKELAHLNGVEGKCNGVLKERTDLVDNTKLNKPKIISETTAVTKNSHSNRKHIPPEVNKVNLNIILSHALVPSKEENDFTLSDQEFDQEETNTTSSNSGHVIDSLPKTKIDKKSERLSNSLKNTSTLRSTLATQQRRSLYHTNRLAPNLIPNNNSTAVVNSGVQNFNASLSLNIQKRPPLVRAMSAPVRSCNEATKSSTFLNTRRKSRRRKLNNRNISFDKGSCDLLTTHDLNFDSKSILNSKVLTRSKSVAPEVVTLVSLISSEGSDSEKEENTLTTNTPRCGSPNRRAPSLRKSGKSVSFQENYPPTLQFSSKDYSHMLRRGSFVSPAQRINSNRPPTAPPSAMYQNKQGLNNEMTVANVEPNEKTESNIEEIANKTMGDKVLEETYEFPEYVRSLKERECWKLFQKMSTKGVHITYDTILRGMLTPTEFRQLQKQREIEEAKTLKEFTDNGLAEETCKKSTTALERLKESLLKN